MHRRTLCVARRPRTAPLVRRAARVPRRTARLRAAPLVCRTAPSTHRPVCASPEMAQPRMSMSFALVFDAVGEEIVANLRIEDVIRLALTSTKFLSGACCHVRRLNTSRWNSHDGVYEENVTALLKRCTGLYEVDSRGSKPIKHEDFIFALMAYCPSLRTIRLSASVTLTDSAVTAMMRMYPGLVELSLNDIWYLTDEALRAIARHLPDLHRLDLSGCREISDAGVIELAQKCTTLKYLDLSGTSITDAAITAIVTNCEELEGLVVGYDVTDAAFRVVRLPKLTHLDLENSKISDAGVIELSRQCTTLKSLTVSFTRITDAAASAVARNCPHLEELKMEELLPEFSDAGMIELAQKCTALKLLNLNGNRITDVAITAIANNCGDLEELRMSRCYNITDAALRVLRLPKLTTLDLESCYQFSDAGFLALSQQCTALKSLNIRHASITDATVSAVARNCPHLEELQAAHSQVTDESLKLLLRNCGHLSIMDFEETDITVASVLAIARGAPNLQRLYVYAPNCILTDEVLYALSRGCKNLEQLSFNDEESQAHITRAAVDALIATNPKLKKAFNRSIQWS